VLRTHQRCQFREQKLRHGEQVALALHHAGELGDVGLQPILFVVLAVVAARFTIISLMLSFKDATSPCASTAIERVKSPL